MTSPKRLFKYRQFSERLLDQLCHDDVYYADPAGFNDPLDCLPVVAGDLETAELRKLLGKLIVQRAGKKIDEALRTLKFKGDKAMARRDALTAREVDAVIRDIEYNATHPDVADADQHIRYQLVSAIERELRASYTKGVLSLSAIWNSPLMWSHYGQQHGGVCIEYETSSLTDSELHRVIYGGSRVVQTEWIQRSLMTNDAEAQRQIDKACLLSKAPQWRYEREWRMLDQIGVSQSRLNLQSVIFGMRCPQSVQYTIVAALGGTKARVKFWEIRMPTKHFKLERQPVDTEELMAAMPRTSVYHAFADVGESSD